MKSNKFVGTLAIETDQSGFFAIGHITDGGERDQLKRINKIKGKDLMEKILPSGAPIIEFCVNRDLLIEILAGMETEAVLVISIYGKEVPIVIRGEECFAVLMPVKTDISCFLDIKKEMK